MESSNEDSEQYTGSMIFSCLSVTKTIVSAKPKKTLVFEALGLKVGDLQCGPGPAGAVLIPIALATKVLR